MEFIYYSGSDFKLLYTILIIVRTSPDFESGPGNHELLTRLVFVGPTPSFAKFFDE